MPMPIQAIPRQEEPLAQSIQCNLVLAKIGLKVAAGFCLVNLFRSSIIFMVVP